MGSTAMATATEKAIVVRSLSSRWLLPLVAPSASRSVNASIGGTTTSALLFTLLQRLLHMLVAAAESQREGVELRL